MSNTHDRFSIYWLAYMRAPVFSCVYLVRTEFPGELVGARVAPRVAKHLERYSARVLVHWYRLTGGGGAVH